MASSLHAARLIYMGGDRCRAWIFSSYQFYHRYCCHYQYHHFWGLYIPEGTSSYSCGFNLLIPMIYFSHVVSFICIIYPPHFYLIYRFFFHGGLPAGNAQLFFVPHLCIHKKLWQDLIFFFFSLRHNQLWKDAYIEK